jgi:hypothetical protein
MLEVQGCRPVIGEVFGHLAGGASGSLANITIHGRIEGISSDDVVYMSRREGSWLSGWIKTLEGQG